MYLAECEWALGFESEARNALRHSIGRFETMGPGRWSVLAPRASLLCAEFSEMKLLDAEVDRGLAWALDPEVIRYQGSLRESV